MPKLKVFCTTSGFHDWTVRHRKARSAGEEKALQARDDYEAAPADWGD